MESLIKQARVRFSDATPEGTQEASSIGAGRRIPPHRTQSFKEKSKTQNWFHRQFSGTMSKDYDTSDGGDYTAAVAAAAYAVSSLYDDITPKKKVTDLEMRDVSSRKARGKTEDASTRMQEPTAPRRSKSLSDMFLGHSFSEPGVPGNSSEKKEGMSTKIKRSKSLTDDSSGSESSDEKLTSVKKFFGNSSGKTPPIKKKISFASDLTNPKDMKETETAVANKPSFRKRLTFTDDKPSLKRPQTSADNTLDGNTSFETQRPETAGLIPGNGFPKPHPRATILPPPPPQARVLGSRADAWERSELAKINKRYDKLRSTIDSWESKKRESAKRQKEKREREIEAKRARVLQHFRHEVESIDAVAKGARAEAEKKKRKEELKVKEKANRIRTTGKLPPTCFCF